MNLSKLRAMNTEQIVRLCGWAMGVLSLASLVLISVWQHHRMTAYECHPDPFLRSYDDDSACANITSLTHFYGWAYWVGAVVLAVAIVSTVVLALMGLTYLFWGEKLRISTYSYPKNHILREDFIGLAIVLGVLDAFILIVYFISTVLASA